VRDLNKLYTNEPVLSQNDFNSQGFRWISCHDADANLISYLRSDRSEEVLFAVACHFGGAQRDYRIGVPRRGFWREVVNTNSQYYGGSGLGNDGGRTTEDLECDGFSQSIRITLPPLTAFVFKWTAAQ
jgi:1,4-alpha-glucan branching enzyme